MHAVQIDSHKYTCAHTNMTAHAHAHAIFIPVGKHLSPTYITCDALSGLCVSDVCHAHAHATLICPTRNRCLIQH
jgi:hypothetical protein